jgi:hypothetical protein
VSEPFRALDGAPTHSSIRASIHPCIQKERSEKGAVSDIQPNSPGPDSFSTGAVKAGGEPDEFLRLVEPLEIAADRTLDGPGREKAVRAWRSHPHGFAVVAGRARKQARSNAVGLLLWMIDRRHHEAAEQAIARAEYGPELRPDGTCFVCSHVGEVLAYAGQWFCGQHIDEQRAFDGDVSL